MKNDEIIAKVIDVESIIQTNGLEANSRFEAKYLQSHGFGAKARAVADKALNKMLAVCREGINGGFNSKRASAIEDLSDMVVKLSELDDGKIKKINQIEEKLEGIEMSKLRADSVLKLSELIDYVVDTKEALDNLTNTKISGKDNFVAAAMANVPAVSEKLGELIDSLQDGKIHDLSSKSAADLMKEIYKSVGNVRTNILSGSVSGWTVKTLDDALGLVNSWKSIITSSKHKDVLKQGEGDLHEEDELDRSIKVLAEGRGHLEAFTIFEQKLEEKRQGQERLQDEMEDISAQMGAIDDSLTAMESEEDEAADAFENDGNINKLNRTIERIKREKRKLAEDKANLRRRYEADERTKKLNATVINMLEKHVYNPVMEYKDSLPLLCEAASFIPYDIVNSLFDGRLVGEDKLEEYQRTVVKLKIKKNSYVKVLDAANQKINAAIEQLEEFDKQTDEMVENMTPKYDFEEEIGGQTQLSADALAIIEARKKRKAQQTDEQKAKPVKSAIDGDFILQNEDK